MDVAASVFSNVEAAQDGGDVDAVRVVLTCGLLFFETNDFGTHTVTFGTSL